MQESVYVKYVRNLSGHETEKQKIRAVSPSGASVLLLPLPIGEFRKLSAVVGEGFDFDFFYRRNFVYLKNG